MGTPGSSSRGRSPRRSGAARRRWCGMWLEPLEGRHLVEGEEEEEALCDFTARLARFGFLRTGRQTPDRCRGRGGEGVDEGAAQLPL